MDLSLIQLRNLVTNYASSASLNAARAYEYRQSYWTLDADVPSQIVDVELALAIKQADPDGEVFVIQIKTIPDEFLDMWRGQLLEASGGKDKWMTSPQYATIHATPDWLNCYEYKLRVLSERSERQLMLDAVNVNETRLWRMAKKICAKLPFPLDNIQGALHDQANLGEDKLRDYLSYIENALSMPIYEPIVIYEPTLPTQAPAPCPELQEIPTVLGEGAAEAPVGGGQDSRQDSGAERDTSESIAVSL